MARFIERLEKLENKEEKGPEILSCPFCNDLPIIFETLSSYHMKCDNSQCDFIVESNVQFKTKEQAIKAWNTRHE